MFKKQLLKLVKIFIRSEQNNQTVIADKIFFREATIADQEYIFSSLLREAKTGHFNQAYLHSQAHPGTRLQILSTIQNLNMPTPSGKNDDAILNVLVNSNQPIGFSWLRTFNEKHENGWEVYLMALEPSFRKQKLGQTLLDETLKIIKSPNNVFVRVYKKPINHAMSKLLSQNKFKQINTNAKDTYLYKRTS